MTGSFQSHPGICRRLAILALFLFASQVAAHVGVSEEVQQLNTRIQANPQVASLYLRRGNLHRINQHFPAALADFERALTLEDDSAPAELGLGRTLLEQGMPERAIEHLNRALALDPGHVRTLLTRASALRMTNQPLAAAADYQGVIDAFVLPDNPSPEYYFERARALASAGAGHLDAAIATLDAGMDRLGHMRILEQYAVVLERRRGEHSAALRRLDAIIDRSQRRESLLFIRGEILLEQGQGTEAISAFEAALAAIDALPPQRRYSASMQQLRSDIERHQQSLGRAGEGG